MTFRLDESRNSSLAREPVASRENLVEAAYRAIKDAIRHNVLQPGQQAAENEIARWLQMSRTPVHEAMSRLQDEGMVRVLPRKGIIVLPLSAEDVSEIYEIIVALEGVAAARLANAPKPHRERVAALMDAATDAMENAVGSDLDAWAEQDDSFHRLLLDESGNRRLSKMAGTVSDQLFRARMFTLRLREMPTRSAAEHRTVIAAIRNGDGAAAGKAARAHRTRARDELIPLIARLRLSNL